MKGRATKRARVWRSTARGLAKSAASQAHCTILEVLCWAVAPGVLRWCPKAPLHDRGRRGGYKLQRHAQHRSCVWGSVAASWRPGFFWQLVPEHVVMTKEEVTELLAR